MKGKLLFTLLVSILIVPLSAAKNSERTHYKCHLRLSDKSEVVHRFVTAEATQNEFEQALPRRIVFSADGVSGLTIESIYQCVKTDLSFDGRQARTLEEKTPF